MGGGTFFFRIWWKRQDHSGTENEGNRRGQPKRDMSRSEERGEGGEKDQCPTTTNVLDGAREVQSHP